MIVVDSNVLAYLYLPGEYTNAAERLLERKPDWNATVCGAVSSATFLRGTCAEIA